MRRRDGKKTAFYGAEDEALQWHGQKVFPSLAHIDDYVRKTVLRDKWFKRNFGVRVVRVLPSEKKDYSSASTGYIKMAKVHYIEYIVLHELAHGLAPLTGWAAGNPAARVSHGREFAHTYLLLVQHFIGAEAAKKLRASFRKHRIKYTQPRQISEEQKEKLRARLAALRAAKQPTVQQIYDELTKPDADIALARANVA